VTHAQAWNTANVLAFQYMFAHAAAFNQPLVSWPLCASNTMDSRSMFVGASSFEHAPTLLRFAPDSDRVAPEARDLP
jgi:hypothetical protein